MQSGKQVKNDKIREINIDRLKDARRSNGIIDRLQGTNIVKPDNTRHRRKNYCMADPWRTLVAGDEQPYRPHGKSI